jgi:hypothetical protein
MAVDTTLVYSDTHGLDSAGLSNKSNYRVASL